MDFLSALSFGLSKFGVDYAIMGVEATAIIYLYKKLMDAKDEQIHQAKKEFERSEKTREVIQRSADNILTFIQSHSFTNKSHKKS